MVGLVVGLTGAYIIWSNFLKTSPGTSKLETEIEISAEDLMIAFENDENKANGLYLNKILEVRGKVVGTDQSEMAKPTIDLETSGFGVIKCTLESADDFDLNSINNEAELTLKGECIGYLLDVLLNNAIILND